MRVIPPTQCPSCHSGLIQKNSILYCVNSECEGQGAKLVENFCKVLKIKGLGPATIDKLEITSIDEIYEMAHGLIIDIIGATLGNKLIDEIEKSKEASLNSLLPALGIPLIGKTAAEKICGKFSSLEEISEEPLREVIGPKASENLLYWLETEDWECLPFTFKSSGKTLLTGKTVCISGKLKSFKTKSEAAAYLAGKGYQVVESVTKTTSILVNEGGVESEKTKKARANGTQIVNNIMEL
jgi:DNA ligase (NAD+)